MEEEIHLITNKGIIYKGGYALREILNTQGIVPKSLISLIYSNFVGFLISVAYRFVSNRRSLFNHLYLRVCSYSREKSIGTVKDIFFTVAPLFIFILFLNAAGSTIDLKYILIASLSSLVIQQTLFIDLETPKRKSPLGCFLLCSRCNIAFYSWADRSFPTPANYNNFVLVTFFIIKLQKMISIFVIRYLIRLIYGLMGVFLFYVPPINTPPVHISQVCFWLVFLGNFHHYNKTNDTNNVLKARETISLTSAIIKLLIICTVVITYLF